MISTHKTRLGAFFVACLLAGVAAAQDVREELADAMGEERVLLELEGVGCPYEPPQCALAIDALEDGDATPSDLPPGRCIDARCRVRAYSPARVMAWGQR